MTIVSHEREPAELGFAARYLKAVHDLEAIAREDPAALSAERTQELAWAYVQAEMLRIHTARRLSERLDGVAHTPEGSIDKLLMTWAEQSVGHAALSLGIADAVTGGGHEQLDFYLYSRAQSVMGGTSQIQKNIIATRILDLPQVIVARQVILAVELAYVPTTKERPCTTSPTRSSSSPTARSGSSGSTVPTI